MEEPDVCCDRIFELMLRWDRFINVVGDVLKSGDNLSGIDE